MPSLVDVGVVSGVFSTEIIMTTDILRPMTDNELMIYAEHCQNHWPTAIRANHFLRQNYHWHQLFKNMNTNQLNEISDRCKVIFFTPMASKPEECTFIAISGEKDYSIFYHTLEDPPIQLEASLRQTKRINWQKEIAFVTIQVEHQQFLLDFLKEMNLVLLSSTECYIYRLGKKIARKFKIDLPDNIRLFELRKEDIPTVVAEWPHQYPGAEALITSLINLNYGLGIFDKQTNVLLSMVFRNEQGALGFMQTVNSAKRKGYASILSKAMSHRLAVDDENDVLTYISVENSTSNYLFQKIGFQIVGKCSLFSSKPNHAD